MNYYLSRQDKKLLLPIIKKLVNKNRIELQTSDPKRLKKLLRNAISGNHFTELLGNSTWRISFSRTDKDIVICTRSDTLSVIEPDERLVPELCDINDLLEALAATYNSSYYFTDVLYSPEDLERIPTTFEVVEKTESTLRLRRVL